MKQPNIIYVLADDMGYGDVSALNEKCPFQTPNYDKLCAEGISFTDAHSTSAVCTPSRYGILTGRYNWRSRLKQDVLGGYSEALIEKETPTVAHMLKDCGYQTACIGKWHLGMNFSKEDGFEEKPWYEACEHVDYEEKIEDSPVTRGFDYFYGIPASLDMPPYLYIENDRFTELPTRITKGSGKQFWREGPTGEHFVHEEVLDELTNRVLEKIEEYQENPFFIYFPMPAPHTPILPSKEFQGKSNVTDYCDFVLHCDDIMGRIEEKIKELQLEEDTIVIFASDNGCSPDADIEELNNLGHYPNYIFRGNKAEIYEGGHRIPYMIKWKNHIAPGLVYDKTVCLSDFFATIADVLDYKLEDNMAVDSVSNFSCWNGVYEAIRDTTVHQSCDGSLALRQGKWKLEMCPGCGGWREKKALEDYENKPRFQLYNLEEDIRETANVIEHYPKVYESLRKELVEIVLNGRSTLGKVQENHGEPIWEAVKWLDEVVNF